MTFKIPREEYAALYGPTRGDRVRLADTNLWLRVERDLHRVGEEAVFGGGKVIRDGMGQQSAAGEPLDLVVTNVVLFDPLLGVVKCDIGVRGGVVAGVGKAGNPDIQEVDLVVGSATEVISGEGLIATPGGVDTHIHWISPQIVWEAISSGITTMLGGGTGPAEGTKATTCTPGEWNIGRMLQAAEAFPVNLGFYGKGNDADDATLRAQIRAGACGLKVHEDWGSTPAALDACLGAAEREDIQVCLHTDTLNEAGYVEDTLAAIAGRTLHAFHVEGAGGGHAPDILRVCSEPNILPSSTTPTRPYTLNTVAEHLDMIVVCHHLDPSLPEDLAFARSRIRGSTMAAEDMLHDLGAISMMTSDSQAMGRAGEVILRTWQSAHRGKELFPSKGGEDNRRAMRYLAKYTLNPAITHGISHTAGTLAPGHLADIVLWEPRFFGVKPQRIIKGGFIAWSAMGDPNASIPTPEPVLYRPMFGAHGSAPSSTCVTFVSRSALKARVGERLGLRRRLVAVRDTRRLTKRDMKFNSSTPRIDIDPRTYRVRINGAPVRDRPARTLPLTQRYFIG